MIEKILVENGFTDKEAAVYLAALEAGEATIGQLAAKAKLKRPTVYNVVELLKNRGLVSVIKRRGSQHVAALSPRVLVDRLKQSATLAEQALPQFLEMAYASPLKPRLRFYEGIDGLKEILAEFAHSQGESFCFTDYEQMPKELFQFIRKVVVPGRREQRNFLRLIVPKNDVNIHVQTEDKIHYGEHRIIDLRGRRNPIEIIGFDTSKVSFSSFTPHEQFGVIIDSLAIHETLKNLFLFVWSVAPPSPYAEAIR